MSFGGNDYDEDELNDIHHRYSWGESISYNDITASKRSAPVFCYDLIDLDKTDYHFTQSCFDNEDIKAYFAQIKRISLSTLFSLIDSEENGRETDLHLHRANVSGKLRKALGMLSGRLLSEVTPDIYHFALYTKKGITADRTTGTKAPRIYFLVGANGMLYVLFYDPYHEINP
jgi:hypothetical protein